VTPRLIFFLVVTVADGFIVAILTNAVSNLYSIVLDID